MGRKWSTREYQPGDEAGIIALWKEAFPEGESGRADLAYWNWQFRDPPAGSARIRVAVVDGTIVGHYAVIPVHMQVLGRPVLAALSLDTMTHPDYRRQGMFARLASELYQELGRNGFPITYGFPNENSVGGFVKKLQWSYISSLPVYIRPLYPDAIIDRIIPNRYLATVVKPFGRLVTAMTSCHTVVLGQVQTNIRWIKKFDTRADELWQDFYDSQKIAVTRNAAFLNWRYFLNPHRNYRCVAFEERNGELVAYVVIRCMEQFGLRGGMITDIVGLPGRDDAIEALLSTVLEYFGSERVHLAACLLHGDRRVTRLLKRNGFLLIPKRTFKEWHFGARVNDGLTSHDLVNAPDNWYVTFGDTDVI